MSITIAGNSWDFHGTTVSMNALKHTSNKEQAISEQRNLLECLTDYFGYTQHDKVIGALFDVVNPKDSDTFQRGILALSSLAHSSNGEEAFTKALDLELTQHAGNSIVSVSLGRHQLVQIEFSGTFEFNDRLFAKDPSGENRDIYKLNNSKELQIIKQFLNSYLENINAEKEQLEKTLLDTLAVFSENSEVMFNMLKGDFNRVTGYLPLTKPENSNVITKKDYCDRLNKIFNKDLIIQNSDDDINLRCITEKNFEDKTKKVFDNLTMEDHAFLWFMVCQSGKYPSVKFLLEALKLPLASNTCPIIDSTIEFEIVKTGECSEHKMHLTCSNSMELINVEFLTDITIQINEKTKQVENVVLDFSNVKVKILTDTNMDGSTSPNCHVIKTKPDPVFLDEGILLSEWDNLPPYVEFTG